ncbi:MAG: DUF4013 domain-containing protein [Chloroflexota bacterium]
MESMEYGKAFTFPQQETDWAKKFLIGAAISLVPVLGSIVYGGYTLEITRRVINGDSQVMPEWSDFGDFVKKGVYALLIVLIYVLPALIFASCLSVWPLTAGQDAPLPAIGVVVSACCGCLVVLYVIFLGLILPAALGRLAATGEIGPALRVNEVFALVRTKPAVYLIVGLLSLVATVLLFSIGSFIPYCGNILGFAYSQLVAAHLVGQAYKVASAESGGMAPSSPATA